jgi:hypothetical protein
MKMDHDWGHPYFRKPPGPKKPKVWILESEDSGQALVGALPHLASQWDDRNCFDHFVLTLTIQTMSAGIWLDIIPSGNLT